MGTLKRKATCNMPGSRILYACIVTTLTILTIGCSESEAGPGLTASFERFHNPSVDKVTFEIKVKTTTYSTLGTPYIVELIQKNTTLESVEVVVDVETRDSSGNPNFVYWQVDGRRGSEVAGSGSSLIENLSAEMIKLEAAGEVVETMLLDLERNETQTRERVDTLLQEKNTWELEVASLEDQLANSEISLVQLGEIQREGSKRLKELGSELNAAIAELQQWERWRTGIVHTEETVGFDSFVRHYLNLAIRSK